MNQKKLIKQLVKVNKKHLLNSYIITSNKEYIKRLINDEIDEYQRYMYDEKLLTDKKFIKYVSKYIKSFFRYVPEDFYNDRQLVINVLNKGFSNKKTLIKLLDIYSNDLDMIKHILKNNGTLFNLLNDEFKTNIDVIKIAIKHSWNKNIYLTLDENLKENFDLTMLALRYSKAHHVFLDIPKKYQDNPQVILETLKNNGWGIQYFNDEIKGNKEYGLLAVSNNGLALQFLSDNLKNDFDIVLTAFMKNPKSIIYASNNMKEVIKVV